MQTRNKILPIGAFIGTAFATSLAATSPVAADESRLFEASELNTGYLLAAKRDAEGKCGEGKCGADAKADAEGKCGEGKCGADAKADAEGKCGEGKCGGAT